MFGDVYVVELILWIFLSFLSFKVILIFRGFFGCNFLINVFVWLKVVLLMGVFLMIFKNECWILDLVSMLIFWMVYGVRMRVFVDEWVGRNLFLWVLEFKGGDILL